jgi:hypothetical protein
MDESEERVFRIYSYFKTTIKNRFIEIDDIEEELQTTFKMFRNKYKEVTNKQCYKQIIDLISTNQESAPEEYENKYSILTDCYKKYDNGLFQEIDDSVKEIDAVDEVLNSCNSNCVDNQNEMDDRVLKKCFEYCFEESFKSVKRIHLGILSQIKENHSKLNKF